MPSRSGRRQLFTDLDDCIADVVDQAVYLATVAAGRRITKREVIEATFADRAGLDHHAASVVRRAWQAIRTNRKKEDA